MTLWQHYQEKKKQVTVVNFVPNYHFWMKTSGSDLKPCKDENKILYMSHPEKLRDESKQ